MNKFLRLITIVICISVLMLGLSACATNDSYFVFEPNTDETGYIITSTEKILPKRVTLPARYSGKPVVGAVIESKTVEFLKIGKNIETLSVSGENLSKIKPNKHFTIQDGVLYNSDITRIVYVMDNAPKNYYIPRTVVSAENSAFQYAQIEQLFVPIEYTNNAMLYQDMPYYIIIEIGYVAPYSKIKIYDKQISINFESNNDLISEEMFLIAYKNSTISWGVPM